MSMGGRIPLPDGWTLNGKVERRYGQWVMVQMSSESEDLVATIAESSPIGPQSFTLRAKLDFKVADEVGGILSNTLERLAGLVRLPDTEPNGKGPKETP